MPSTTTLPIEVPVDAVAAVPSPSDDRKADASVMPVPSPETPEPDPDETGGAYDVPPMAMVPTMASARPAMMARACFTGPPSAKCDRP